MGATQIGALVMTVLEHLLFALGHVFGTASTVGMSEDAMLAVV